MGVVMGGGGGEVVACIDPDGNPVNAKQTGWIAKLTAIIRMVFCAIRLAMTFYHSQ